jgi:hypothetical protein
MTDQLYYCSEPGDGSPSAPWTLIEVSASGARLRVTGPIKVASRFRLAIPDLAGSWLCELAWKSGDQIGVKFIRSEEQLIPPADDIELDHSV